MQFKEKGIDYIVSETIADSAIDVSILEFINSTEMESIELPLPEVGCIIHLNKEPYSVIGYVGGHHAYSKKFFIDIFIIAPHLRDMNIGSNLMLYFLKYIKALGFNRIFAMTQSSNTGMINWYNIRNIPITLCYELDLSIDKAISKFSNNIIDDF